MRHFQNARTCICDKSIGMSYPEVNIFVDHFVFKKLKYYSQEPRFEEETERPKTAPLIQEKSLVSFIQVSY
jgi:hypothetical protein